VKAETKPAHLIPGTAERINYLAALVVLDVCQLAEFGNVSKSTVRRAIDAGDLPVTRIGRRVLITADNARRWLGIDATEVAS